MTYIPNVKDTDLKGDCKTFLQGYDAAVSDILCLEGNLEVYSGESLLIHYLEENEDKAEELFSVIKHWIAMQRNEAVAYLLDEQYNEEES